MFWSIYVDVISNKQSILSSQIHTPSFPINWPSLVSSAQSPIILWRPWSYKPSHKHDLNKYQSKAFGICDHKSDETKLVTHVNKAYHYTSTAPIRSCVLGRTQFFKIVGFAGRRFLLSPPPLPSPVIPFLCFRPNFLDELAWKRLLPCHRWSLRHVHVASPAHQRPIFRRKPIQPNDG